MAKNILNRLFHYLCWHHNCHYRLYCPNHKTNQTPNQPSPTSTIDEITNWKTYKSDNYGFSINYPPTWEVQTPQENPYYKNYVAFLSDDFETESSGNLNIKKGYGVSLFTDKVPWSIPGEPGDENITPVSTKEFTWLGQKAWLRHYNYEGIHTVISTIYNNKPIQITAEFPSYEDRTKFEPLLLQVANTLVVK